VIDQELLGRMLEGDEESFTELYRRRQAAVYRFALQMTGSAAVADDVTQEVFLTLLEHGRRFDAARGTLASFLYGVARNLLRRRMEKERAIEPEVAAEEFVGDEDLLEDLTRRETIDQVRRAAGTARGAMRISYVENPDYQKGSILSLWRARETMLRDSTLIMDADVLFPDRFLRGLIDAPAPCALPDGYAGRPAAPALAKGEDRDHHEAHGGDGHEEHGGDLQGH